MATYVVKSPSGKTYEVTAPDTASPDEIKAYAAANFAKQEQAAPDRNAMSKMALEGTGPDERVLINLGAGLDSAWQGLKGLVGAGPGDAAVKEKRAADKALAQNTEHGGAWQTAAEVAPGFAIPGGAIVKGAQALRAAPAVARLGTGAAILDSAAAGGVIGAAQMKTDNESRLENTVMGAVGGALLPTFLAAGSTVRGLLTRGGAEGKAAAELIKRMGGEAEAEAALAKMRAYAPQGVTKDIPMSAAEITQNPALGRAERTAQARYTEDWAPFRADQAQARYGALQKATENDLPGAKAAREATAGPLRDDALKFAGSEDLATPVKAAAAALRSGDAGTSPAVKRVADYVEGATENLTPERLYTVRKTLLDKLNGKMQIGDELSAATKQARRETMGMVKAIDDSLDNATAGQWTPYLKEYASKSGEVDSATALTLIRKGFDKESAPQIAGVPSVTGARLATAIGKHGENSYGTTLTPKARGGLQELQDNVEMTEGLQKLLRMTGTSGGGSNTAMDMAGGATHMVLPHTVAFALAAIKKLSGNVEKAAMSDALRNPDLFIASVSKKLAQRLPLTKSEESVLALLRSAGSGAALELAQ